MKVGDFVMFFDISSPYAKWFYGSCGIVTDVTKAHCRVQWLSPVLYHDDFTKTSDFHIDKFIVI